MKIRKFNFNEDYQLIKDFLTNCYFENNNMECWLPQRFDDLVFRLDTLYRDERGQEASQDFIYIWLDSGNIVGVILPDGDSFNSSIKKGYEYIFPEMLDLAERKLIPLFKRQDNGKINFLVVAHDSLKYQSLELLKRGYTKDAASDYDNCQIPSETNYEIVLPDGFKLVFGKGYDDLVKAKACYYGFEPSADNGILSSLLNEESLSYTARKKSSYFNDSFETLVVRDDDICSYSFCYVDKITKTAFIEPVSTREKYRGLGLCTAMMHGIVNKLKTIGIDKVYVNSYD